MLYEKNYTVVLLFYFSTFLLFYFSTFLPFYLLCFLLASIGHEHTLPCTNRSKVRFVPIVQVPCTLKAETDRACLHTKLRR